MTRVRLGLGVFLVASLASGATGVAQTVADDARRAAKLQPRVASIMEVLRASHADPSTACANALDDMNTTDQQLRQLSGAMQYDNETSPVLEHNSSEMGVGRDVLISDMEATVSICGPEAHAICAAPSSSSVAGSCAKLAAIRPSRSASDD